MFSPIFVADTKIIFGYNFVASLGNTVKLQVYYVLIGKVISRFRLAIFLKRQSF